MVVLLAEVREGFAQVRQLGVLPFVAFVAGGHLRLRLGRAEQLGRQGRLAVLELLDLRDGVVHLRHRVRADLLGLGHARFERRHLPLAFLQLRGQATHLLGRRVPLPHQRVVPLRKLSCHHRLAVLVLLVLVLMLRPSGVAPVAIVCVGHTLFGEVLMRNRLSPPSCCLRCGSRRV